MTRLAPHDFGLVEPNGDFFEFHYVLGQGAICRLEAVVQTERGPRRQELAAIPTAMWRKVSVRVVRELALGMGETERSRTSPRLKTGTSRLSPLIGRELAVLLWVFMEEGAEAHLEAILHGWRELAREERWWLFAKASAPGQRTDSGWRRALFHALSESVETRAEKASPRQRKSPEITSSPGVQLCLWAKEKTAGWMKSQTPCNPLDTESET